MASGSIQCLECRRAITRCDCKWDANHRAKLIITLPRTPDGAYPQVTKSVVGGKKAAQDELRKFVNEHQGRTTAPSKLTVTGLLDEWLAHITARGRSATTIYNYRNRIRADIVPAIGNIEVRRLTVRHLDDFYTDMSKREKGGSPASIRQVHAIVRAALNYAEKRELVTRNVARHAGDDLTSKHGKKISPPTPTEVQHLLDVAYRMDRDMGMAFRLAATTGARRASIVALRSSDVSFADNTIRVERSIVAIPGTPTAEKPLKYGQGRTLPVDAETMQMVADHITHLAQRAEKAGTELVADHYLFSPRADGGEPMRPDTLTNAFIAVRKKAGLPTARLHDLRHFVPTQLFALGFDAVTAAERLIHASSKMTLDVYSHAVSERAREAGDAIGGLLGRQSAPQEPTGAD